jgi:hypothetical protein
LARAARGNVEPTVRPRSVKAAVSPSLLTFKSP